MKDKQVKDELYVSKKELNEEISNIRIELIRQDHRFVATIRNLYLAFKEDDGSLRAREKKLAAIYAFASVLWRRRMAAIIVASIGGLIGTIIAILTLMEFKNQNLLFQAQNKEILQQNKLFRAQNEQSLIATNGQMVSSLIGDLYEERNSAKIHKDSFWEIPQPLLFRILSVTNALTAYDTITKNDKIIQVSREKGELLRALISMKVDFPLNPNPNFSSSLIKDVYLSKSDLENITLSSSYLENVNLSHSNMRGARLASCIIIRSSFGNSNLASSSFNNSYVENSVFHKANFNTLATLNAEFINNNFKMTEFHKSNKLTFDQLFQSSCIFRATGLREEIVDSLKSIKSCIINQGGCEGHVEMIMGSTTM